MTTTVPRDEVAHESGGTGRLALRGAGAGLLGGVVLAMVVMVVMGLAGQGFWSPVNLGIPAFVTTVAPPLTMLPALLRAMGVALPASAMGPLGSAIASGHLSSAMAQQLGAQLESMHVPASTVAPMGQLMTGHATNATVSTLLSTMSPRARDAVMAAMPVSGGRVVLGLMLHMMMSAALGAAFFLVIVALRRRGLGVVRGTGGVIGAGVLGGAVVYAVMRWVLLPPTNSMMAFVPQWAFFAAHLMFGLVVGALLARTMVTRPA